MEQIAQHIEFLLSHHECVVVPGLGAFLSIYHAPVFDLEKGSITPPVFELRFNSALKEDDGLLTKSVARKLKISYREASEILNKAIVNLIHILHKNGEITIGRLGSLIQGEDGAVCFSPFKTAQSISLDLGLINVPFPKTTSQIQSISVSSTHVITSVNKKTAATEKSRDAASKRKSKLNFEKNYYIPLNKIIAKVCVCLIVVILMTFLWIKSELMVSTGEERASVVPFEKIIGSTIGHKYKSTSIKRSKKLEKITPTYY